MGSKRAVEAPKKDYFMMDPNDVSFEDDTESALYDGERTQEADENLVLNMMQLGVLEPILAKKDGTDRVVVIAGRRRALACREANRRSLEAGGPGVRLPVMFRRGSAAQHALAMVAENECRLGDSPLSRARKAEQLRNIGATEDEIMSAFGGVTSQTLRGWSQLMECSAPVQRAVEAGRLKASAARLMAGLSASEQREKLAELLDSGTEKPEGEAGGKRPSARKVKETITGEPVKPGLKAIKRLLATANADGDPLLSLAEHAVLQWVLTGETRELSAAVREAVKA